MANPSLCIRCISQLILRNAHIQYITISCVVLTHNLRKMFRLCVLIVQMGFFNLAATSLSVEPKQYAFATAHSVGDNVTVCLVTVFFLLQLSFS